MAINTSVSGLLRRKKGLLVLVSSLWFCSCVEPFELNFKSDKKILIVDATLNDSEEEQTISLTETFNNAITNSYASLPVQKAKVEVLVNGTERIQFTEKTSGIYALPASFRIKAGNTYRLFFQRADGTKYESEEEKMTAVPEITRVYDEFVEKGIERGNLFDPANYIYLDTQDPIKDKNNYLWSWKLWEQQTICTSCLGGRFFVLPTPAGKCSVEPIYKDVTFDYACDRRCWDIFYNPTLNVFSDVFTNGQPIIGRLVAKIPYYSTKGSLVEIKQQSVSTEAYRYLKLLAEQTQNTGSLVDTPPAPIIGNIRNLSNTEEAIGGYFMITSVRIVKYWLNRQNAKGKPVGLLDHPLNFEPSSDEPLRPPLAPCIQSFYRTPTKPNGWID